MRRLTKLLTVLVLALAFMAAAGNALAASKMDRLQANQYAWSGAIRWGDFEGALTLIDPEHREAHPVTDLELKRYEQVQITAYRERGSTADKKAGIAVREVEIGVVNRHTQAERTVRYREEWRWDDEDKNWWLTTGLPDLWDGE
jgi:hypothetical protein